jgi:pimeloyl-ACP methyl ester carboxylesterase
MYFGAGSAIAGIVASVVLAHPFSASVTDADLRRVQQLGIVKNLDLAALSGWLVVHPDGVRPTIVFIHGRSSNRMQMLPVAQAFFARGFNAVLWDLPHHGNSGGPETYGKNEIPDVLRIIERIRNDEAVDPGRIDLLGFSLGAAMAIGAASADKACTIHAIAADSSYADLRRTGFWYVRLFGRVPRPIAWPSAFVAVNFGAWMADLDMRQLNPDDWAASVRAPVLLIHGQDDRRIEPDSSSEIYQKLTTTKELWDVPNAGHTEVFYKNPQAYVDRVSGFFSSSIKPPCPAAEIRGLTGN